MQYTEQLLSGNYYHIYNHGVGGRNLYCEPENYKYFLELYDKHISLVVDTFAWVLMPNHFHLLVRIKEEADIITASNLTGFENLSGLKIKPIHQYFSNLFNAYTKALNKRLGSRGSLFERPFKRRLIDNHEYLKQVILYIHNNPVHHGFCSHPAEYPWSSYLSYISVKPTKLHRDQVLGWFDDQANFIYMHNKKVETEKIEKWLEM